VPDEVRGGVVFDVDGTLLDTNYLHVAAWWEAFRELGHDIQCADIHRALGMGSTELIERVLGKPEPSVSAAHSRNYAPYLGRIRPLPGAADLLRATARLELDVVLATSAKADEVDLMLDALGAGSAVSAVVVPVTSTGLSPIQASSRERSTNRTSTLDVLSWSGTPSGM
jgi:phosphoglycolate phosphatase-like HAD superfamily hydrolase